MRVMSFVQEFVTLLTESKVIMFKKESNHINHTTQCRLHLLTSVKVVRMKIARDMLK